MGTNLDQTEQASDRTPQGSMFCQRCFGRTPVHMLWFRTIERGKGELTVGQCVCDECLDAAASSLESARQQRLRLGQRPTLIRLELL